MSNRRFSVFVLVLAMLLVLPGAALAGTSPRFAAAPDAPLVLTWTQRNASGFGDKNNAAVSALEVFGGQLYAGTQNDLGTQIRLTADGTNWSSPVILAGISGFCHGVTFDMIVFNGQLYAGLGAWPAQCTAGEIWRTANGTNWAPVLAGLNAPGVSNLAIFGSALYATVNNPNQGISIYRSSTGNLTDWSPVSAASGSFGLGAAYGVATGLAVFNNALYVALSGQPGGAGPRIYRTLDGTNWSLANTAGFGGANYASGGFAVHNGYLYVGTGVDAAVGTVTGGQIWRSADGTNWTQVGTNGFGSTNNRKVEGLVSVLGTLFAFTDNDMTGTEVWSSTYGSTWVPSNTPGFGSVSNKAVALWSNGSGSFANQVFLGTFNQAVGGQVWSATPPVVPQLLPRIYLPLVRRG